MARGTSRNYLIERLHTAGKRKLLGQVARGELSAHAAALEAGIVKPPASKVDTLLRAIVTLKKRDRDRLLRKLGEQLDASELITAIPQAKRPMRWR